MTRNTVAFNRRGFLGAAGSGALGAMVIPAKAAAQTAKPIRVLSIDGGGMRGIIPARFLQELEQVSGKRVAELFDVVVGTSTGALLSLGITVPDKDGKSKYSAEELVKLYDEFGPVIFHKERGLRAFFKGYLRPTYDPEAYEGLLEKYYGATAMSEALIEVAVPAVSLETNSMKIFSRRAAQQDSTENFLMRDIVRAATAAPSYFPAARIRSTDGSREGYFVDAGISTNNPALLAFAEAKSKAPESPVHIVSLGTGKAPSSIDPVAAADWGEVEWLTAVFDLQGNAQATYTHDVLSEMLVSEDDLFFRFQVGLGEVPPQMDVSTPEHMADLKSLAMKEISYRTSDIEALAARLANG